VLILVDGVRVNNSTFRQRPNQYFNSSTRARSSGSKCSASTVDPLGADAIGGVINVVTRSFAQRRNYGGGSSAKSQHGRQLVRE
jgi:outer membrane cobalamin receptor